MKEINPRSSNYYYFLLFYLFLSLLLLSFNIVNKEFNRKISLAIKKESSNLYVLFTNDLVVFYQNIFLTKQTIENLRISNQQLNEHIAELNNKILQLNMLEHQVQQLNSLLHIKDNKNISHITTTKVINKDISNLNKVLDIPLGKADKIKPNSLVTSQAGVVGYIVDIYENNSKIITTINPLFKISANTEQSNINVVVNGNSTLTPDLTIYSDDHNLIEGENVLTSGLEGYFPPNIPIGKIVSGKDKQWKVKLFESFSHINYVHIVN